ncbi:MAG: DUF177 domain-containing protein [Proteobacteria bacterium]|nr:DUF177 domain-containing protein [Pseudomonadota bacterium]
MSAGPPSPEFSRPIDTHAIEELPFEAEFEADEGERAALARRFGLVALPRLAATVSLERVSERGIYRLSGHLSADVVQSCVVTLEPVERHHEVDFERLFSELPPVVPSYGRVEMALDDEEPPEPMVAGVIEAGEAVAEELALALEPYPRAPGSSLDALGYGAGAADDVESPFSVLKGLRPGRRKA